MKPENDCCFSWKKAIEEYHKELDRENGKENKGRKDKDKRPVYKE